MSRKSKILPVFVFLFTCFFASYHSFAFGLSYRVCGWNKGDKDSITTAVAKKAIHEVSMGWYYSKSNTDIYVYKEDLSLVSYAKSKGLKVLAAVSNYNWSNGTFDPLLADDILKLASRQAKHTDQLVNLCVNKGYDGIDLDWESLYATDKTRFSTFVALLAQKLHAKGKTLSIAVHAKTSEPGNWDGPKSEDWAALGSAVDEFKIMTYAYSGTSTGPGPISPPDWVDQVLSHAETLVPPSKIMLGIHFYGLDWAGTLKGSSVSPLLWTQTQSLIATYNPIIRIDINGEANFLYLSKGIMHTVYYQDRVAIASRLTAMRSRHPAIKGIHIWKMGGENQEFWDEIALQLQ